MSDCIHHLDICNECGGLNIVQLNLVAGVASINLDDGRGGTTTIDNAKIYIGPAATSCPNTDSTPKEQR